MIQVALRVARAATGRSKFVKFAGHYHGWFDNVLTNETTFFPSLRVDTVHAEPQSAGQSSKALGDTVVLPWNDVETLRAYLDRHGAETAAIITEPVMCNTGVILPASGYLEDMRRLCDVYGVIFIIDEVITGFRLGLSGAQGLFGVAGDLGVFAKALGGGVPIAALTGRESLMSLIATGAVNHSGTYNSNLITVAAAIATLDALAADHGAVFSRIQAIGQALMDGMRALARAGGDNLIVQGYPSVFNTAFGDNAPIASLSAYRQCDKAKQRRFLDVLLEVGIRPTDRGTWFVSAAHTELEVENTLSAVRLALEASR